MKNYYEILEVNNKASKEVIEKAYKVLVKKNHPDLQTKEKQKEANKKIKEINEAYDVLSNDFLREQYDKEMQKEQQKNEKNKTTNKNEKNQKEEEPINAKMKTHKTGGFLGIIELLKQIYQERFGKEEKNKKVTKKDIFAVCLTIIIIIIIGVILWFIPFTNGWVRELLFENPLFNWIGSLFSK